MSYFDEALISQELLHTTYIALQFTELAKETKKIDVLHKSFLILHFNATSKQ